MLLGYFATLTHYKGWISGGIDTLVFLGLLTARGELLITGFAVGYWYVVQHGISSEP